MEIRVVPKELMTQNVPRSKTLNFEKPAKVNKIVNGKESLTPSVEQHGSPKVKLERTKSILKQSSKERTDLDLPSPKRESITFAPDPEPVHAHHEAEKVSDTSAKEPKPVQILIQAEEAPKPKNDVHIDEKKASKSDTESSHTGSSGKKDGDAKANVDSSPRRISVAKSSSNSHINFEPIEALNKNNSTKRVMLPGADMNLLIEPEDSSSSTRDVKKIGQGTEEKGVDERVSVIDFIKQK